MGGTGRGSSRGGGGTPGIDLSSGLLRSRVPGGQKGRGRMREGALWLGIFLAGANNSKRRQSLPLGD